MTQSNVRFHLLAGSAVHSLDGSKLGAIKELEGDSFKVGVRWGRDYWLPVSAVAAAEDDKVTMAFDRQTLDDYKRSEPAPEAAAAQPTHDALISDDEQDAQRRHMEEELAEQRRNLPHN